MRLVDEIAVFLTSGRHHVYKKTGHKEVELKEVGPRFELRRKSHTAGW